MIINYDPAIFWERQAKHWIEAPKSFGPWSELVKKYSRPEWNVLELGCGDGRWADTFENYTGSDVAPSLLLAAKGLHPTKTFRHHDMRRSLSGNWDLIFTFTAWEHMPPASISGDLLPDTRYLFVEPFEEGTNGYCFKHDYERIFGVKKLHQRGKLAMYGRGL
jgi:hypothetical protein